jgi:hypothetical protein
VLISPESLLHALAGALQLLIAAPVMQSAPALPNNQNMVGLIQHVSIARDENVETCEFSMGSRDIRSCLLVNIAKKCSM